MLSLAVCAALAAVVWLAVAGEASREGAPLSEPASRDEPLAVAEALAVPLPERDAPAAPPGEPAAMPGPTDVAVAEAAAPAPAPPLVATLRGRVLDELGEPIAGVHAVLVPRDVVPAADDWWLADPFAPRAAAEVARPGRSDVEGHFAVAVARFGLLSLALESNDRGRVLVEDVLVRAGDDIDLRDLFLPRGPAIEGWVLDEAGRPVAGAEVLAWTGAYDGLVTSAHADEAELRWLDAGRPGPLELPRTVAPEAARATLTDAEGRFVLGGLAADEPCSVAARLDPWHPAIARDVLPGERGLELVLAPRGQLLVHLLDDFTRRPVERARLRVLRLLPGAPARVDAELAVTPAAAEHGAGAFLVDGACEALLLAVAGDEERGEQLLPLEGCAPGAFGERTLLLRAEGRIDGYVFDAIDGSAIAGARIDAHPDQPDEVEECLRSTAAIARPGDGRFSLTGLGLGRWRLSVSAEGYLAAESGALASDRPARETKIRLTRAGGARGAVTRADGAPARDALVVIERWDPGWRRVWSGTTDADGRYAAALAEGKHRITVGEAVSRQVTVEPPAWTTADFTLPPPALLRVHVESAGMPVPGARIDARQCSAQGWTDSFGWSCVVREGVTDARGELLLSAPRNGLWRVAAMSPRGGWSPTERVELVHGSILELHLRLGDARGAGQVVDAATGRGIAGAHVRVDTGGAVDTLRLADSEGRFDVADLWVGTIKLSAQHEDYVPEPVSPRRVYPKTSRNVWRLELRRAATLRGALLEPADGPGVTPWIVRVAPERWSDEEARHSLALDGSYRVAGLSPGKYLVSAQRSPEVHGWLRAPHAVREPVEVELAAGEDRVLDLDIAALEW